MENIKELMKDYNKVIECLKKDEELIVKEELKRILDRITFDIQKEIKKEKQSGNTSEEFIQLCSKFDAISTIENKNNKDVHDNKEIDENEFKEDIQENNYTLSSNKIISSYDGSEIDISNLTRIEKIKTIYEHTGIEINNQDPEVLKLCDLRFQEFLRGCDPSTYEQKYGSNWQQEVEKIYKSNYLETVQKCIANGLNEVDEKNRIRMESVSAQLQNSEEQVEKLSMDVKKSSEERTQLLEEISQLDMQKEELEQYKEKLNSMIKNNSEDKDRFYSDGTLKPDMDDDEYGRYTTSRKNRSRETGMQQRINDAAHVHSPLDSRDQERLQNKYEQVFGAIPIQEETVEEDKPKSR